MDSTGISELRRTAFSPILIRLYRFVRFRRLAIALALRLEGGEFFSFTLREILNRYHGVRAGAYTYGECMVPGSFPRGVTVGRYVSMAPGVRVFLRNHPLDRLSLHPFFYNRQLGWVPEDTISSGRLEIGHDAWIGERAIVTPGCKRIGIGAVIGAGAVVTRDVMDFAVVAGNPARVIRYRFPEEICTLIRESRWWEKSIDECAASLSYMTASLDDPWQHPLLAEPIRS
jgi:acetyltransferase-like isoleucine patch superfamily enzyme